MPPIQDLKGKGEVLCSSGNIKVLTSTIRPVAEAVWPHLAQNLFGFRRNLVLQRRPHRYSDALLMDVLHSGKGRELAGLDSRNHLAPLR